MEDPDNEWRMHDVAYVGEDWKSPWHRGQALRLTLCFVLCVTVSRKIKEFECQM